MTDSPGYLGVVLIVLLAVVMVLTGWAREGR